VYVQGQELPARAEIAPLTEAQALERMLFAYQGMPRSLAERRLAGVAVVAVHLNS